MCFFCGSISCNQFDLIKSQVRSIWRYTWENFASDFDFFTLHGDDVYYIVENLRQYLLSPSVQRLEASGEALYMGRRMSVDGTGPAFNTGASSYVLNKVALGLLVKEIASTTNPECPHTLQTSEEDVCVARCLKSAGVLPLDTRDAAGGDRFHPIAPETLVMRTYGDWFVTYSAPFGSQQCEGRRNMNCISVGSCAFHYIDAQLMRWIEGQLYACRPPPSRTIAEPKGTQSVFDELFRRSKEL